MSQEFELSNVSTMPVIALRGITVFPNVMIHFEVAREISVKALEDAMSAGQPVFLVAQKDISVEEPSSRDLYTVGTISNIRQILRMPGDNMRVMVEGHRAAHPAHGIRPLFKGPGAGDPGGGGPCAAHPPAGGPDAGHL